jgi:hypothetical protein
VSGDNAAEEDKEVEVALIEGERTWAFDVEGAKDGIADHQWHGQGAAGVSGAGEVEFVILGISAEVAAFAEGDVSSDAVAGFGGEELPGGGFGSHAVFKEGDEFESIGVQQADLEGVVAEDFVGGGEDMFLEECDAFFRRHLRDFVGGEVPEFKSGAVDGFLFLFFLSLSGDVSDGEEERGGVGRLRGSAGNAEGDDGFVFATNGDVDGRCAWFREADAGEISAIGGCENALQGQ